MDIKLNEIIENKLNEKFTNGEIDKIMANAIDKCITDIVDNMFTRYDSPLKKELEAKLSPIMQNAIANSTVEGLVDKLTVLINKALENKEINDVTEAYDRYSGFEKVTGGNIKFEFRQEIKLSNIFEMYAKFVEKEAERLSYNTDDLNYDDGKAYVYWNLELEEVTDDEDEENRHSYFYNSKDRIFKLSARPDNDSDIDENEYNLDISFKIYNSYDNTYRLGLLGELNVNDLIHAPKFVLDLYSISSNWCKIVIDKSYMSEEICIEVEQEY